MTIPNLLVPFVAVEIDATRAQQGSSELAYRALLLGQKLPTGTAAADTAVRVTSAAQASTLGGRGSQLHRQALAFFANATNTETWLGVLNDSIAGVVAQGALTFTGPATASGTLALYVAGQRQEVAVAAGASAAAVASAVAAKLGVHASGTVTFSAADAADNVTVGTTTFVGTTGAVTPGDATYSADPLDDAATAASFAAQVNAHPVASQVVRAFVGGAVVLLVAHVGGTAGNSVVLTSTDPVDVAVSGSGALAGAGTATDLPVYARAVGSVVTVYARNAGPQGNDIDIRLNYATTDATPAGLALAITPMAGGAGAPSLTALLAALGDRWFNVIAHPYTDSTSLDALEAELADRFGPTRMLDGLAITSASGDAATLLDLGETRNSPHSIIVTQPGAAPLTPPAEFAAAISGIVATEAPVDPARPYQTLAVRGVVLPADEDLFPLADRDVLLRTGIATTRGASGLVQVERLVTTYQRDATDAPSTAYRDVTTLTTLAYFRYSFRLLVQQTFPRHKLADRLERIAAGQAVVTPAMIEALALTWFRDMEGRALIENFDAFKSALVVERDATDRNRVNILLPPDLINQLIGAATTLQFRL